jgi:hypothetical protein
MSRTKRRTRPPTTRRATSKTRTTTPRRPTTTRTLVAALAAAAAFTTTASASDATLKLTFDRWSTKIAADARAVSLDARQRHPRRLTTDALRFRRDALLARTAIGARQASSTKGRRAKILALSAYADYAKAGTRWAASGRARLARRLALAAADARAAATYADAGNRLLIAAGRLLA